MVEGEMGETKLELGMQQKGLKHPGGWQKT